MEVWQALDCVCSLDLIRKTLGSIKFQRTYGLSLAPPFPEEILPASQPRAKTFPALIKPDFIRGVLGSMTFRNTYHLALVAEEGPDESSVDTYVFKPHS